MQVSWRWKRLKRKLRVNYLIWRDGYRCAYCHCVMSKWKPPPAGEGWNKPGPKGRQMTIDHVVPRSMGGGDKLRNLALCCATCNSRKGNMSATAYLQTGRLKIRQLSVLEEEKRALQAIRSR